MACQWAKGPDGKWAVSGPLEELRKGSVLVTKKNGAQVQEYVGTPLKRGSYWIAYPIKPSDHGGSWWSSSWKVDLALPTKDRAANTRPAPALRPIQGEGTPVFGARKPTW